MLGWLALQTGRKIGYWKPRWPDYLGTSDSESASRGKLSFRGASVPVTGTKGKEMLTPLKGWKTQAYLTTLELQIQE